MDTGLSLDVRCNLFAGLAPSCVSSLAISDTSASSRIPVSGVAIPAVAASVGVVSPIVPGGARGNAVAGRCTKAA